MRAHQVDHFSIFFGGPRAFHELRIQYLECKTISDLLLRMLLTNKDNTGTWYDLLPSMQALYFSPVGEGFGNLLPVPSAIQCDRDLELLVLAHIVQLDLRS